MNCYELTMDLINEASSRHHLTVKEARVSQMNAICDLVVKTAEAFDSKYADADVTFDGDGNALLIFTIETLDIIVDTKDSPLYDLASTVNSVRFVQDNSDYIKVEFVISDLFVKN